DDQCDRGQSGHRHRWSDFDRQIQGRREENHRAAECRDHDVQKGRRWRSEGRAKNLHLRCEEAGGWDVASAERLFWRLRSLALATGPRPVSRSVATEWIWIAYPVPSRDS